ncbi:MAG: hypothetical protein HYZ75_09960 [Elusimicrobia bacterium]|nr:hypothetical protein [Elusimicrobiota bacterium]
MRNAAALCALLVPTLVAAQALPPFGFTPLSAIRATSAPAPLETPPPAPAADVITDHRLLIRAGRTVLFGFADNAAEAEVAARYWTEVLTAAGVEVGTLEFSGVSFTLPYKTADGRVIRRFFAEPQQFPPKDPAGLRANMESTRAAMERAGLTPLAARVVNVDFLLPTYTLFYLTRPAATEEKETQLRVLNRGDDLDADVYRRGGLEVLQVPKPWMLVYIGPEAGYVSMAAGTRERAEEKLKARREFLAGLGKRILEERVVPIDEADYPDIKFIVELYFVEAT